MPSKLNLNEPYPNPFNSTTNITYAVPYNCSMELFIFDIKGRVVKKLVSGYVDQGYHKVRWSSHNHASGVYFVKMTAGGHINTQKLMLIK